jgi:hypothetical protein
VCESWPRTRVAAAASTGLQAIVALIASFAARVQRSYVASVLTGSSFVRATQIAGRSLVDAPALGSTLGKFALPLALVIALLAATRRQRCGLATQVAVVGLVPAGLVVLVVILAVSDSTGRELAGIALSCVGAVAWLPLAARAADFAAARFARASVSGS